MSAWLWLLAAIVLEVIATSLLNLSQGMTRLAPSVGMALGYSAAFFCLSKTLLSLPMGIAYAIWSGLGLVLITLAGWLFFRQKVDLAGFLGMGLILAGVIVMNVFSQTSGH